MPMLTSADDTSDIGRMYMQELQRRGQQPTASNMRDLVMESRRNPDLLAGLTPQGPDPTAGAVTPPNIAGASARSSGQAPPMQMPARAPLQLSLGGQGGMPAQPPPTITPPDIPQGAAAQGQIPPAAQIAQMVSGNTPAGFPGQGAPMGPQNPDMSSATPPPGATPDPTQSTPPPDESGIPPWLLTSQALAGAGAVGLAGAHLAAATGNRAPQRSVPVAGSPAQAALSPNNARMSSPAPAPTQAAPAAPSAPPSAKSVASAVESDARLFPQGGANTQRTVPLQQGPQPPAGKPPEPIRVGQGAPTPTSTSTVRSAPGQYYGPPPPPPAPLTVGGARTPPAPVPVPVQSAPEIAAMIRYGLPIGPELPGNAPYAEAVDPTQRRPGMTEAADPFITPGGGIPQGAARGAVGSPTNYPGVDMGPPPISAEQRAKNIAAWEGRMRGGAGARVPVRESVRIKP